MKQYKASKIKLNDLREGFQGTFDCSKSGNGRFFGNGPVLFSRGMRIRRFFTEDSRRYITPREKELLARGARLNREEKKWDSICSRIVENYGQYRFDEQDMLNKAFQHYYQKIKTIGSGDPGAYFSDFSLVRLWNFSMVGAVVLGMVTMTFIYQYLGPGALADSQSKDPLSITGVQDNEATQKIAGILEEKTQKNEKDDSYAYFEKTIQNLRNAKKEDFERKIEEMVEGYPIEEMVPYIAKKDPVVAAFLVSIARKESGWGVHVPVLNGQDCYNYWGYRGQRKLMGTGGHTCFNSREDAVDTVAKRIDFLVNNKKLNTPEKMVIWKCGSDCEATGGQAAARKWISDVNLYFEKLNK
jgi:hypothetical protein